MDQAIIFLGIRGHAQFIQFNPLKSTSIKLPDSCVFVVANSLSEFNKAATKDFNQRVVECRLGARYSLICNAYIFPINVAWCIHILLTKIMFSGCCPSS